ncbi:MAG: bifunctional prephenate dehydrogenase/3-phosphoshikimate 1-carboxyvinyltransferase [Pseudomonadota bacterium]
MAQISSPVISSPLINKLVVIGIGLIGGSLALGLKKRFACKEVIGIARREKTCEEALALGVVDRAYTSLADVASELRAGDVIFISVPTLSVKTILQEIKSCVSEAVTLTDGASVKGNVQLAAQEVYGEVPAQFVLGHPIAGAEKSGVSAANPDLYELHRVILTPLPNTGATHLELVTKLWQTVGAEVLTMTVAEHDEVLAATSHLPHAIAYSLVDTLAQDIGNPNIFRYAAGGFRDFTRIASSDPIMWHDIMRANKNSVLHALDLFINNLTRLRTGIETENSEYLLGVFTRAKVARDHFTNMLAKRAFVNSMSTQKIDYVVQPGGKVVGTIRVPGDKSISHRSIMLGSLAEGITEVEGFLEGEDALATLQAFRDMGVVIEGPIDGYVKIHGVGLYGLKAPNKSLYMGNSGTTIRLMSGILSGQVFDVEMSGDESLAKRPMNRVANPLREMGAQIETGEGGRPPLKIRGGAALTAIDYVMPMASAQVKSCVLLAGLYAKGTTRVTEPAPTRDHTERMLTGFGYSVKREGAVAELTGGGKLIGTKIEVPSDISSATFFMVAASIAPGSDVTLVHVGINPTRIGVINILRLMGGDLTLSNERIVGGEPVADIRVRYAPLKGIRIPEDQVPLAIDEFPALFIAAACAQGETILTGAEELRVKESDRIQSMADGLQVLGIDAQPTHDGIVIQGGQIQSGAVETHHDHRIAMSFTIAALRANGPIHVKDSTNVVTSFPTFVQLAKQTGINLEVINC